MQAFTSQIYLTIFFDKGTFFTKWAVLIFYINSLKIPSEALEGYSNVDKMSHKHVYVKTIKGSLFLQASTSQIYLVVFNKGKFFTKWAFMSSKAPIWEFFLTNVCTICDGDLGQNRHWKLGHLLEPSWPI